MRFDIMSIKFKIFQNRSTWSISCYSFFSSLLVIIDERPSQLILWCAFVLESIFLTHVCVCLFLKKKKGNCPTLLKKVCCIQYNLPHPPLKVIMTFEWSCGVFLCQNPFLSPLCVCVCFLIIIIIIIINIGSNLKGVCCI